MQQKILSFKVDDQFIRAPHYKVVSDSKNYLAARFSFSEQWQGLTKTAVFQGMNGKAYHMLLEGDTCVIPAEVITPTCFLVSVFGGDRLTTDRVTVEVEASGCVDGITPPAPTPDIYAQLVEEVETERQVAEAAAVTAGEKAEICETASGEAAAHAQAVSAYAVAAAVSADDAAARANEASFYAQQTEEARTLAMGYADGASNCMVSAADYAQRAEQSMLAASQAAGAALDGASGAENAAAAAAASAEKAAQTLEDAVTKTELDTALNAKIPLKEWQLIADITLEEAVVGFTQSFEENTYTELWAECELTLGTDSDTAKTGIVYIYGHSAGTLFNQYWGSIANGSKWYLNAHMYHTPSGKKVCALTRSTSKYTTNSFAQNTGTKLGYGRYFNRFGISFGNEAVTPSMAVGSTIKVWGR